MTLYIDLPLIDDDRLIGDTPPDELAGINIDASKSAYDAALYAVVRAAFPDAIITSDGRDFRVYDDDGNADTDETRSAADVIAFEAERLYGAGRFWVTL